jgi:hypothetical protein
MQTHRVWCIVLVLLVAGAWAWAAESPPAAKSAPAGKAEPAAEAAAPAPSPVREESIYIPYAKLREVFEKEGRGVFISYDRFMTLWQSARDKTAPAGEAKPPVDSLISEVDGKATVSKDVVNVTAELKIEVLKEGWNEVPLRLADVALTKATLDGEPARILFSAADGGHKLLIEKKGKAPKQFVLTLQFAKAYTKAPGQNSVSFESPAAPVSRWEVHIPESGVKVNVQPLLAATEMPPAKAAGGPEETVVLAFVGAAPTVRLDWTPKAEGAKGLEALASVRIQQRTNIEEGVTRTWADLAYDISRAELGRLEIEVPANQKVVNVFDPNVREWSVTTTGDVQKITVQLFEPAKKTQNLTMELERFAADPAPDVRVPGIKAVGVGRQQGFVVVHVAEGLRAEATERTGLAQVDESELPEALRGKGEFAYRYAALPFELALKVEKVQPRIVADTLVQGHLGTDSLALNFLALYTIERAGIFRLELDIPEGYDVRSVRGASIPGATGVQVDSHHLEGEKKTRLVVNLARKAMGRVALEVQLHRPLHEPDLLTPTGKAAAIPLAIPRVAAGTVERETGRLIVFAPESLIVNPKRSDGLRSIPFAEAVAGINDKLAAQTPTERAVLSFAFTQEPVTLALEAERRKPQITARQLLVGRVDSGVVKYEVTLSYDILYSGVKSLRLDVPKDLAADLRIVTPGIRHQLIEDQQALKDLTLGYEAWSLAGETEFMGKAEVRLAWERKIEKLDVGQKVTLTIPRLIPRNVDRSWGQIVLAKAETIDIQESAEPGKFTGLRGIDPQQDLMPGASVPGAARAFEFHDDWALAVEATMYKLEDVKRTSIERGLVRMVVTRSGLTPVQALYRVRSARQRLLVKLPDNVTFDTEPLRLNGRPVSLERGGQEGGTFFVPLVGVAPDTPFLLELRYTVSGQGLRLECPAFPEEPAVQKVYLSVYLPQELDFLGSTGPWTDELVWVVRRAGFKPVARQSDSSLISELCEGCTVGGNPGQNFPTDGNQLLFSTLRPAAPPEGALRLVAVNGTWLAVGVFAIVAVIGVGLMFTRARMRLLAIGAAIVLVVLSGVFLPTFSRQTFDGVTMSAVFLVLILWGLWYLLVTRPRSPSYIARRERRQAAIPTAKKVTPPLAGPASSPPPAEKPKSEGGEPHA